MPQASRASKNQVYKAMGKSKYAMKPVGRAAYKAAGRKASRKK